MADAFDRLKSALADRYAVERELGAGGMATVYLAEDLKHSRKVAVKVLRPELAASLGPDRFLREIEIAANLTHPHILPLHDSGEADGFLFYVMPYIDGESLRQCLNREGTLALDVALSMTREVTAALIHAHERGVIHRDIKPENILLAAGQAIVADFGIARAVGVAGEEKLTATGVALGTPDYMSPEQAYGDQELDGRSDLYSLACVLYEVLTGAPPFEGPTPLGVLSKKISEAAPGFRTGREDVSEELEAAVLKALAAAPEDRYATLQEFDHALSSSTSPVIRSRQDGVAAWQRFSIAAVAVVLLGFGAWWMYGASTSGPGVERLLVLPPELAGDSGQIAYVEGQHRALISALGPLSGVQPLPRRTALTVRDADLSISEIAKNLDARWVVDMSVERSSDSVWLGIEIWSGQEEFISSFRIGDELGEVQLLHSRVARAIARDVGAAPTPADETRLASVRSVDPEAYDAHQWGLHFLGQPTASSAFIRRAIEHFERAILLDSTFAPAYAGLAMAYSNLGVYYFRPGAEVFPIARGYADRALAVDSTIADGHAALGLIQYRHHLYWDGAERSFQRAIGLNEDFARAHYDYGWMLGLIGRWDESLVELRKALDLDPTNPEYRFDLGLYLVYSGAAEEGLQELREAADLHPEYAYAPVTSAYAFGHLDRWDDAVDQYETYIEVAEALSEEPPIPVLLAMAGQAYAKSGNRSRAEAMLNALMERQVAGEEDLYIPPDYLAQVHVGMGRYDEAMALLEQAYREREQGLVFLKFWNFRDLRPDPRFQDLLRRVFGEYADR